MKTLIRALLIIAALAASASASGFFGGITSQSSPTASGQWNFTNQLTVGETTAISTWTPTALTLDDGVILTINSTNAGAVDIAGGINIGSGNVAIIGTDGKINGPLSTTIIDDLSGANLTTLTAANISAGSLGSSVIASSIAVNVVGAAQINDDVVDGADLADTITLDADLIISESEAETVTVLRSSATTTPGIIIKNELAGDSSQRFYSEQNNRSWAIGLDQSASSAFKISHASNDTAVLGTNDYLSILNDGTLNLDYNVTSTGDDIDFTTHVVVTGNLTASGNSIVDAYTLSFGAVTAGSTSTVTWTEVTDRLGEFVTSSFTATSAAFYEVIAHGGASQTAGSACLILKNNGTAIAGGTVCNQGVTGLASVLDVSITRILNLAANDIVRLDASATTADATFQKMTLTIKRLP